MQAGDDRAPQHETAVAITCDAAFQPYASFLADQLASAHSDRSFDILICSPAPLAPLPALSGRGVGHVTVDPDAAFQAFPLDARRSIATYLWLALPGAVNYRRILALDADVFHERGDLSLLLDCDMHGHAVAAVRDNRQWRTPGRRVREFRKMGWPAAPYFNCGVTLIDTDAFRRDRLFERCLDFARNHLEGLGRDQALANCVLRGDWAELSPVWNWQYTWSSAYFAAAADPHLVHFIGPAKPWRDANGELPFRYTAAYEAFLAQHFPNAERAAGLSRRRRPRAAHMRRSLLKHWRSAAAMERYLGRFPSESTVVEPR